MFKDVAGLDAGVSGPLDSNLNQAQMTFLGGENAAVPAIQSGIDAVAADNGIRANQATAVLDQHQAMATYFTKFISAIEDADLPTAISRLNQDQLAAQAARRMIAQINQISLMNFMSAPTALG